MKTAIASNVCEPLLEGSAADSPVSPALQNNSVAAAVIAPSTVADKAADNYRIKQVKAVVTEIKKKRKGKPEIKLWEVRVGSAISKIYFTPSGERELFTLVYWLDKKRKREVFPTKEKAIAAAKSANTELSKGDLGAADLTAPQRVACARALDLVAPFGVPIELVASHYAYYKQKLKDVPFERVVDDYARRHPVDQVSKMVRKAADELIESKRADKLSDRYILQLTYDMKRFCGRFCGELGAVRGVDVDTWLRELKVGPRTRNNLRASVQVLFNYGIARKYLPKDHDEIDAVPLAKDKGGEIEIFTPKELAELLAVASAEQLPFMAISAFAGVRHAEIQRLDWANVNKAAGIIEIKAGAAKTASRRVIPILPNLAAWLKPHRKQAGPVCSFTNMVDQFKDMTRAVNQARRAAWAKAKRVGAEALKQADERAAARRKEENKNKNGRRARGTVLPLGSETAADEGWVPFAWKHNALRHSFISYRVAETQDVAKVSLEAGNSPQMIFKHYRELVQPKAAKAWFAIRPAGKN
jgi:integrase